MRFTASIIVLALAATAVSAQNYVNGTRMWNNGWSTYYNGTHDSCGTTQNNGCDVDCSAYGSSGMTLNIFSGAADYSSYTYRLLNIANLNVQNMMINQQGSQAPLYVQVDSGFSAGNIWIGYTGYLKTTGGFNQNSVVLNIANFYMSSGANIIDNAFKVNVGNNANLADGATATIATMLIHNTGSIGNVHVTTTVGFLVSATVTATNSLFDIGGSFVLQNPAGSNPASTTALSCSGSAQINAANMYTVAPTSTSNCNFAVSGTLYSTPAASGNKRDGSTQSTTFNGGSSNTNHLTQTGSYLGNLLGKRDMNEKRVAVYPNQLVLNGGHQMQVNQGMAQNGVTPTLTVASCSSKLKLITSQTITQACPGCQSTATNCANGVFVTQPPSGNGSSGGNKRGDEAEASN